MTVRGQKANHKWVYIGLLNIVLTFGALLPFYHPPNSILGKAGNLDFFGISVLGIDAGTTNIMGITLEHEFIGVGLLFAGIAAFIPALMVLGLILYLSDFANLFVYPYGLADFSSNVFGSAISIIIGVWIGVNLYFVIASTTRGQTRGLPKSLNSRGFVR